MTHRENRRIQKISLVTLRIFCLPDDVYIFIQGIGLDSAVVPLKNKNLFLVQSVDFFYPLCDDAKLMGELLNSEIIRGPTVINNFSFRKNSFREYCQRHICMWRCKYRWAEDYLRHSWGPQWWGEASSSYRCLERFSGVCTADQMQNIHRQN